MSTIEVEQKQEDKLKENITDLQPSSVPKQCKLGVRFRIDQLVSINTASQSYTITGKFDKEWIATTTDVKNFNADKTTYKAEYNPSVDFNNVVQTEDDHYSSFNGNNIKIKKSKLDGLYYNYQRINVVSTFSEEFEVENYPFDVQDLSFVFSASKETSDHLIFVRSHCCQSDTFKVNTTWFSVSDWDIVNVDCMTENVYEDENYTTSYVTFRIQVKRKYGAIMMRTIIWMFLLGLLCLFMFSYEPSNIDGRMGYAITMVLTIVAFQFIISSELPKVSYLTLIDKYNFLIMTIILCISLESILVGYQGNGLFQKTNIDYQKIDEILSIVFVIVFIIGHIFICIYFRRKMNVEQLKIGRWNTIELHVQMATEMQINNSGD